MTEDNPLAAGSIEPIYGPSPILAMYSIWHFEQFLKRQLLSLMLPPSMFEGECSFAGAAVARQNYLTFCRRHGIAITPDVIDDNADKGVSRDAAISEFRQEPEGTSQSGSPGITQ